MTSLNIKSIRNWILSIVMVISVGGFMMSMVAPQAAYAAGDCNSGFLGFPAWYKGLTDDTTCDILSPSDAKVGGLSNFIWRIGLNILGIALAAIAYISAFYFLYGGFLFITSQGKPEGAAKARSTLLEALIGLIISMASIILVDFVVTRLLP